jgi:hypothetical protein
MRQRGFPRQKSWTLQVQKGRPWTARTRPSSGSGQFSLLSSPLNITDTTPLFHLSPCSILPHTYTHISYTQTTSQPTGIISQSRPADPAKTETPPPAFALGLPAARRKRQHGNLSRRHPPRSNATALPQEIHTTPQGLSSASYHLHLLSSPFVTFCRFIPSVLSSTIPPR